jgi:hypothetical protein
MKDYIIEDLKYINENKNHFIEYANLAHERFKFAFGTNNTSSTKFFRYYNATCLTVGSQLYYKMFQDLQRIIRKHSNTKKELWYQSWINFHKQDEVLDWHEHVDCLFHGYISIDPKDSETEFENYKIKNEIGKLYLGPADKKHRVNILKPYEDIRITIAFDVISIDQIETNYKKYDKVKFNIGFIPIFI